MPMANSSSGTERMMSVVREMGRRPSRRVAGQHAEDHTDEHGDPGRGHADDQRDAGPVDRPDEDVAAGLVGAEPEVRLRALRDAEDVGRLALVEVVRPVAREGGEGRREDRDQDQQPDEREPGERELVLLEAGPEELPGRAADDLGIGGLGRRGPGAPVLSAAVVVTRGGPSRSGLSDRSGHGGCETLPRLVWNLHECARSGLTVVIPLQIPAISRFNPRHFDCFGRGAVRAARGVNAWPRGSPGSARRRRSGAVPHLGRPLSLNRVTRTATTISAPVASWMRRKGRESG